MKLKQSDLNRIVKRVINEDYRNASELFDMEYRKVLRALHEIKSSSDNGDCETSSFISGNLIHILDRLKSFVDEMRENR